MSLLEFITHILNVKFLDIEEATTLLLEFFHHLQHS